MTTAMDREVCEAINAGENALYALKRAQNELHGARNWGILDMFGGRGFSTFIKHSKINNASQCMEQAKYELRRFSKELKDVEMYCDLNIQIGDFLIFADYFFDGLIADWMVQSRINDAARQVEQAICKVENVLGQLRRRM